MQDGHSASMASQLGGDSIQGMRAPYCLTGKWLEQSTGAEFLQELQSTSIPLMSLSGPAYAGTEAGRGPPPAGRRCRLGGPRSRTPSWSL
jgi:hypothetical protein